MESALIYFFKLAFVAGVAGLFRVLINGDFKGYSYSFTVFVFSGFVGAGLVALVAGDYRSPGFNHLRFIGYAAILGLTGKEVFVVIKASAKNIVGKFIQTGDSNGKKNKE